MNLDVNSFKNVLRGIDGTVEINRLIGFLGGLVYVVAANVFVGYEVFVTGKDFDLTAYCLAFPGGLAAIVTGTAGAVAIKDRNVASATVTARTGSKPATPPNPAPKPQPRLDDDEVDLGP